MRKFIIALAVLGAVSTSSPVHAGCSVVLVTAYASDDYPGNTADGTPTRGNEGRIAAGGDNYTMGSYVTVAGLGTYRIADRGHLAASQIDVLMVTHAQAMRWGNPRVEVCTQ